MSSCLSSLSGKSPPQVCVVLWGTRGHKPWAPVAPVWQRNSFARSKSTLGSGFGVSGFVQGQRSRSPARQPNRVLDTLKSIFAPRTSPFLNGSLADLELNPGLTCEWNPCSPDTLSFKQFHIHHLFSKIPPWSSGSGVRGGQAQCGGLLFCTSENYTCDTRAWSSQTKPYRATKQSSGKGTEIPPSPRKQGNEGVYAQLQMIVWTFQALNTAPSLPHSPNVPQTTLNSTTQESSIKASSHY